MYRAAKYPRKLWEIDHATGKAIHWSPDTGKQEDVVFSTDQGFWDAYRTTYSWLALLFPERFAESMQGWLMRFEESGWVPQWAHPGITRRDTQSQNHALCSPFDNGHITPHEGALH